jgi:murein DD-endopeptidase MepM/ murein hydrolase activator NlpD
MNEPRSGRTWNYLGLRFPERQIYIRSEGRVHFWTFSPLAQAIVTGASLLCLGWVAFTTVNVVFKDRIISAKERHFEQMQTSYEGRIAELQLAYDELNGALIAAQDRFKTVADEFEAKQLALSGLLEQKDTLRASLGIGRGQDTKSVKTADATPAPPAIRTGNIGTGGSLDYVVPDIAASFAPPFGMGAGTVIGSIAPYRVALPEQHRAPFLRGAVQRLGSLFGHHSSETMVDNPAIHEIAGQEARVTQLDASQQELLESAKKSLVAETTRLKKALQTTGVNSQAMLKRVSVGGPLISVAPTMRDDAFRAGIVDTTESLNDLAMVVKALNSVPLDGPLTTSEVSSGFGGRADPFTEEAAFHSGIDFSAAKGSDVFATAPGIVIFAGPRGAYGNTVEIDHGYGIRTRYGHLSKISVPLGQQLARGEIIGKVGSTGRSTGPHVHYEVWYDNAVRDPGKFIKAGRNVRKE